MGLIIVVNVPSSKGALCYCLDEFSKGAGAAARIEKLREALAGIAPKYTGLAEVFDEHLVSYVFTSPGTRKKILEGLNAHWFDPTSPTTFFPDTPVSEIYAKGVIKTLDLSLKGKGPAVPIDAWWMLDLDRVLDAVLCRRLGRRHGGTLGHPDRSCRRRPTADRSAWAVDPWRYRGSLCHPAGADGKVATTRVRTIKVPPYAS